MSYIRVNKQVKCISDIKQQLQFTLIGNTILINKITKETEYN